MLRSLTEIDDRFLADAMQEPGSGKTAGRGVNRYSRWALTAAACLTVLIVGSYVVLHQPSQQSAQKSEVTALAESDVLYEENDYDEVPAQDALSSLGAGDVSMTIANPFTDAASLEEAEKIAGFRIGVPDAVPPYDHLHFRAAEGKMLEIIYADEEDAEGYRIRKAVGTEDISGDYNEYKAQQTALLADGTKVTLRGNQEGSWSVAAWTASGYSYAVCAGEKDFTADEILKTAEDMTR